MPSEPEVRPAMDHHPGNVELRGALPEVLRAWAELTQEAPWHVAPDRFGVDALNEVVRAVLDVAAAGRGDYRAHERLVRVAAAHGDQRRAQGAGDDAVLREYAALRQVLWRFLQRSRTAPRDAVPAILRIDVAVSVATHMALRGYHRAEFEPAVMWEPQLLKQIHDASEELVKGLDRTAEHATALP